MGKRFTLMLKVWWYFKDKIVHLLITAVIFLAGWLLIFLGCDSTRSIIASSLLFSVGASLIASGIVVFLDMWRELAREGVLLHGIKLVFDAGLQGVFPKRDLDKYDDQMSDAEHVVDIAGYTLNAWFESYGDLVVRRVQENSGFRVRILMVDPNSSFSIHRAGQEGKTAASVKDSFDRICEKFADSRNIQIRTINTWLTTMIFRIDSVMYVGPHLYKRPSKSTLTMELERSGWLFEEYEREFERLWEAGKPVSDGELGNRDESDTSDDKS